jgi:hypothetical protein
MSPRYAPATLGLLLCALVPTVVNSYFGSHEDSGPDLEAALPKSVGAYVATDTARRDRSIRRSFDATAWAGRRYLHGASTVELVVARTLDMKRVYHHPELALTSGAEYASVRVESHPRPGGGEPIHVHVLERATQGVEAYTLLYEDVTVANPFFFHVKTAPRLLLGGRKPMTLVFVQDAAYRGDGERFEGPALDILLRATENLLR